MASNDNLLAWGSLVVAGLGAMFMGVQALKALKAVVPKEIIACPNCGQPFDVSLVQGFSPGKYPLMRLDRRRTCPRCWYTWE